MKIIKILFLSVGILSVITMSMLVLAQFNLVHNAYSTANKEISAKVLGIILLFMSCIVVIISSLSFKQSNYLDK